MTKLNSNSKCIDLGEEVLELLTKRFEEIVGDEPIKADIIRYDCKEVEDKIFRLFYFYQVNRNWSHAAERTARIMGIDRKTVYRKAKKQTH